MNIKMIPVSPLSLSDSVRSCSVPRAAHHLTALFNAANMVRSGEGEQLLYNAYYVIYIFIITNLNQSN